MALSFAELGKFSKLKRALNKATGKDNVYYSILKACGYAKSNQIPTVEDAAKVLECLEEQVFALEMYEVHEREAIQWEGKGK